MNLNWKPAPASRYPRITIEDVKPYTLSMGVEFPHKVDLPIINLPSIMKSDPPELNCKPPLNYNTRRPKPIFLRYS